MGGGPSRSAHSRAPSHKARKPAGWRRNAASPMVGPRVDLPAARPCGCRCDWALEITHGERVAGLLPILRLASALGEYVGAPFMEPHLRGGSMVSPHGSSMPISTYIETALDGAYCAVDSRRKTQLRGVCVNGTAPHWCDGGTAICVTDWTAACSIPIHERAASGHQVGLFPSVKAALELLRSTPNVSVPHALRLSGSTWPLTHLASAFFPSHASSQPKPLTQSAYFVSRLPDSTDSSLNRHTPSFHLRDPFDQTRHRSTNTPPLNQMSFIQSTYKHNGKVKPPSPLNARLSSVMRTVASRVMNTYVGPSGCGVSGAAIRLAYRAGAKADPSETTRSCTQTFSILNRSARVTPAGGRCMHFLATDWFVSADGVAESSFDHALLTCWRRTMSSSAPSWWWPSTDPNKYSVMLFPATYGLPSMERALVNDPLGFRVFFDVSVLASVDHCYQKSHMGSMLVSEIRQGENRSPCQSIPKNCTLVGDGSFLC
ncbi:hypothetical protein AB1Y20_011208 [Prymnesium parvum]|uniref:Uncharacterized protein n=1 Tax=Prymnesium parvum TaxID=97485 RepID=A0AB34IL74_PRYPA